MSDEADYVNELPEGAPEGVARCRHRFMIAAEYEGRAVKGRWCGLPVEEGADKEGEPHCYFHGDRDRSDDAELKTRLEKAVEERRCLCESRLDYGEFTGARLWSAHLQGARLWSANLAGARLLSANLQGANLDWAKLPGANLQDAKLQGASLASANLQGAKLHEANLQGARLERADLRRADLLAAQLQGVDFRRAHLQNADLRGSVIGPCLLPDPATGALVAQRADWREANLADALLASAAIAPGVNLEAVTWVEPTQAARPRRWLAARRSPASPYCLTDERCTRSAAAWQEWKDRRWSSAQVRAAGERKDPEWNEGNASSLVQCEGLYRALRLNYMESGDYRTAGEFYLREMECKRAQMVVAREPLPRRGLWALMYLICGYGERPGWTLLSALGCVVFFAFVQGWLGIREGQNYIVGPGLTWPSWTGFTRWFTAAYFSVTTFTTLGYGDVRSAPCLGRLAAGTEALAGFVLLSLFLVCIVRKFSR
jgi:uncharacterized protein YjbI with pentapeptide repeats